MIKVFRDGQPVAMHQGRVGNKFHIGVRQRPGESPRYALCSANLAYKTRPDGHYELYGEMYLCPICRRRAEREGMIIETEPTPEPEPVAK